MVNSTPVGECQAYILLDSTDWVGVSIWQMPTPQQVTEYYFAGLSLPVFAFVVAACVRQVIKMFDS